MTVTGAKTADKGVEVRSLLPGYPVVLDKLAGAEEVHAFGLADLESIEAEKDEIARRLGGSYALPNTLPAPLVSGRRGTTLVSFNEHGHLDHHPKDLVTYRSRRVWIP